MSDYHILIQDSKLKTANCVFHIPIPEGNNSAGITWAEAIIREQGGADEITSVLPDISAEELSALKAGTIYEQTPLVRFSSIYITNTQRLNEIKATFTANTTTLQAEKQISLDFHGYEGDV